MIGDFDNVKFCNFADSHSPRIKTKDFEELLKQYGFEITFESISKYRQGKAKPRGAVIYALAKILGVHYFDLLEGLEAPKKSEIDEKYNKLKEEDKKMILSMIERIAND